MTQVSCFAGTCHLLRLSDFPLPGAYEKAYEDVSILAFETEIETIQQPKVQQTLMSKEVLSDKMLSSVLSPETYTWLSEYCAELGLPIEALQQLKPSMTMLPQIDKLLRS